MRAAEGEHSAAAGGRGEGESVVAGDLVGAWRGPLRRRMRWGPWPLAWERLEG